MVSIWIFYLDFVVRNSTRGFFTPFINGTSRASPRIVWRIKTRGSRACRRAKGKMFIHRDSVDIFEIFRWIWIRGSFISNHTAYHVLKCFASMKFNSFRSWFWRWVEALGLQSQYRFQKHYVKPFLDFERRVSAKKCRVVFLYPITVSHPTDTLGRCNFLLGPNHKGNQHFVVINGISVFFTPVFIPPCFAPFWPKSSICQVFSPPPCFAPLILETRGG